MKARIKKTGEVVNLASYTTITLAQCDLLILTGIHNIKVEAENFIDACYELIIKLHEQKVL